MRKNFNLKNFLIKLFLVIGLIAVDLITKEIFAKFLSDEKKVNIITNVFSLQYTENSGAAYGIFSENTTMLIIVSVIFLGILAVYDFFNSSDNIWYNLGLSFIVGGAIGNLIDRIFLGYVRDFANFEIFKFIFNLADAFITFGLVFFVIYILITIKQEKKSKQESLNIDSPNLRANENKTIKSKDELKLNKKDENDNI